ncbi:MAG: hypothetical protein IKE24_05380 [Clostridia bacterium]|nr:hypothetical protein [Clostridia bacterium]
MNGFWQKMKNGFARMMVGRYGADQLGMATLMAGVVLYLIGIVFRSGILNILSFALYAVTVFRMFSRKREPRMAENRKYLEITGKWRLEGTRFIRRQKNKKEYKYFRCPQCRQLLRMKRGQGEKEIRCAKCGNSFKMKS